jgi:hypothetical protein
MKNKLSMSGGHTHHTEQVSHAGSKRLVVVGRSVLDLWVWTAALAGYWQRAMPDHLLAQDQQRGQ